MSIGLACLFAVLLAHVLSKRQALRPVIEAPSDDEAVNFKNYHLILDALERSNVLLWWARVTREGSAFSWKIRTPPLIGKNPIYRLASLVDQDWLWKDEQSPDHERMNQTSTKALLEGAGGYQQEFPIIGPDAVHWLSEEVTIRPEGPNAWNLMGVIVDVTKRHQVEEALHQEEALFSNLVNTSPDHIYFKDRQSRFIRINAAMARAFGIKDPSDAVGKTDSDIFSQEHAQQTFVDEQRIMETGEPMVGAEEKETWPNGRITWVSTTKVPMRDAKGTITGLIGISRDVTERRLADAQLREQNEILSNSHEGVIVVNLANKITLWNRAAEKITGWDQNEALGREPMDLLRVEDPIVLPAMRETLARDGYWTGEIQARRRDGSKITIESRVTLVRDEANRPRGRLNLFADITERKLAEEKLLHAQRIESIGMLAAGIAHDLNNMLAPIVFAAPLLRPSLSDPEDVKILESVAQSAARGTGLVKQILGFAQNSGSNFQPTQVKHLIRDIVSLAVQTFPKSIEIKHDIPANLWTAMGDATQIHQVLLNLCVNARDAMPHGGTLTVGAYNRRVDETEAASIVGGRPGAWLVLEVGDTGTGIPPEVLEQIWTPFFTTKRQGKGSGLGLSTVRGIVANHKGFVELRSEVGRGSTFRVFLPAVENETPNSSINPPSEIPLGHGELILLVDDDVPVRNVGAAILERHGYRVATCADGEQASTVFASRAGEISLVITDVDMPHLGGLALVKELVRIRPDIRLLSMSGLSDDKPEESDVPAIKKLTHAFLVKPFNAADLLRTVHSLLHPSNLTLGAAVGNTGPLNTRSIGS